ncbi:MAG: hypothetical protein AAF363_22180, partial [Bacteroidota bacterium]
MNVALPMRKILQLLSFLFLCSFFIQEGLAQVVDPNILEQYAFQYEYDGRRRMIEKKAPGAAPVYLVYDDRDRLVLTQDGAQRKRSEWLFTKYDALNRPVSTGIYYDSDDRVAVQQKVKDYYSRAKIEWITQSGITEQGGLITKTGTTGWNAGASSQTIIADGADGVLEAIATETHTNRMFGLSTESPNHSFQTIDYAIYLKSSKQLGVYESGANRGILGTYVTGDYLSVRRRGNTITYEKNGEVFYTSLVASSGSLIADLSLHTIESTLQMISPRYYEEKGGTHYNYTNQSFPSQVNPQDYHNLTYYDNYDYHHANLANYQYQPTQEYPTPFNRVKTLVTGSMTRILNTGQWLRSTTYYDDRYRPIQTISDNHRGGVDRTSNTYDFVGNLLQSTTSHKSPEPLLWKNQKNIEKENNTFSSTSSGWNSGASTINRLESGEDGYVETTVMTTTGNRFLGFNDTDNSTNYPDIDHSIYLFGSSLRAYYQQQSQQTLTTLTIGDVVRLSRESDTVKIYLNSELLFQFTQLSTDPVVIDLSLNTLASLSNIQSNFSLPKEAGSVYPVVLEAFLRTYQEGDTLIKNSHNSYSGNASSLNRLKSNTSGWVQFTAVTTDRSLMAGLAEKDIDASYTSIDYAISLVSNGDVRVFEKGANRGTFGTYQVGDEFRVERLGSEIRYLQNGQVFYTSEVPSYSTLIFDASLHRYAKIRAIESSFYFDHGVEEDIEIEQSYDYDHADRLINSWYEVIEIVQWDSHTNTETENNILKLSEGQTSGSATNNTTYGIGEHVKLSYTLHEAGGKKICLNWEDNGGEGACIVYYDNSRRPLMRINGAFLGWLGPNGTIGESEYHLERRKDSLYWYQGNTIAHQRYFNPEHSIHVEAYLTQEGKTIEGLKLSQGKTLLAHNAYNELGELIEKNLHAKEGQQGNTTYAQSIDYRYNIRGWLKSINNADLVTASNNNDTYDLFGMELSYTSGIGTPQYNGNISGISWKNILSASGSAYAYEYDALNRLTQA